ncbi:MAG: DUF4093 domain-containing protein [Oscillospiraceae bacterium]|nr:DUF4093 domain-containing protein [Oscillospiraceae bacterium]
MMRIQEAIVVEGRYDKAALAQVVDTVIIETKGFGIFSDEEKLALLRRLAQIRGLVVLTDGDGGGFVIRKFLRGAIDPSMGKHAYVPDIYGKERRKKAPSREGKLGVEGMSREILEQALRRAGVTVLDETSEQESKAPPITKAELYALGFSGRPDSAASRGILLKALGLPERMTTNAMLEALNVLSSLEEIKAIAAGIQKCWDSKIMSAIPASRRTPAGVSAISCARR